MTRRKNFKGQVTPRIIDTEYVECNFVQPAPINVAGKMRGVRLFPGDNTPRTFEECNLINCEVPPGSTVIHCNQAVVEYGIVTSSDRVQVDGGTIAVVEHHVNRVHGRQHPDTLEWEDKDTPDEIEVD